MCTNCPIVCINRCLSICRQEPGLLVMDESVVQSRSSGHTW